VSKPVVVEADGGARGNPGPAGWGAVVRDADSGDVLAERSAAIGRATNNVAEYRGLIGGLEAAAELGATSVDVRMDSKLVIEQMAGRWQIRHPGLRPLAARAAALVRQFDSVTWTWVPRSRNAHADRLANQAMDRAADGLTDVAAAEGATTPAQAARNATSTSRSGSWEPPSGTPTRLILIRHGETELTMQRRYSGRGDVPLTPRGREQAAAAAARIAALAPKIAAVVTSPLQRCVSTGEVIAAALGDPPMSVDPDLIECDFGEWEGRTYAEVRARWPQEMAAWHASTAVAPPGGESFQQVAERVRAIPARLASAYPASAVVVVSHVSPLKLLLRDALAASDELLHRLYLDPTGISVVDSYPDGGVAVRTVNDTSHLTG